MKRTNFYINRKDTIQEIQGNFSHFYPLMEINFFSYNAKSLSDHSCVMYSPEVKIRDISPDCRDGCIELNDQMTFVELENLIQNSFKIHAEISVKTRKRYNRMPQMHR